MVPLGLLLGDGKLSMGAQFLTMPSLQDKLVFYIRSHLIERVQLLKGLKPIGLLDPSAPEILEIQVSSIKPWKPQNCLGKTISSLPWGLRQRTWPRLPTHSPAQAAHEALGVVGTAQGRDDLTRDEVPAAVAAGAIELLVVLGADVLLVLKEEARLGQATATHWRKQGGKQEQAESRDSLQA